MSLKAIITEINESLRTTPILKSAISEVAARHGKKAGSLDQLVRRRGYRLVTRVIARLEKDKPTRGGSS